MTGLAEAAARLLATGLRQVEPLSGGDLSQVLRLHLADGRRVVAKASPAAAVEAGMLARIAAAGVPAPRVLAHDDRVLVLGECADRGGLTGPAWADLGRVLTRLHACRGSQYGWPCDYAFGPVRIANAPMADWPRFWAERRLLAEAAHLPAGLRHRIDRLCSRIAALLPRHPPASLLHGDLWTGNILTDGRRITGLIDPACCFGDAEADLAMLTLFGRPPPEFWAARGLPGDGWEQRQAVYQLWPVIVHLRLFGAPYRGLAERLLDRLGV